MLALRFVVEQNYAIDQLLIVTFTKAATKELKERVRARLVEAKQFLTGQSPAGLDANIRLVPALASNKLIPGFNSVVMGLKSCLSGFIAALIDLITCARERLK
jgi:ATP-dependent exoDNAse (exonuclease V) beta subunit